MDTSSPAFRFHPFNPRRARLALALGMAVCAGMAAWAVRNATQGSEPWAMARAGVALGLLLAFLVVWVRLRPRPGWGLVLAHTGFALSPPFRGEPLQVPWDEVRRVLRAGRRRQVLVLELSEGRLLLPSHLFASPRAFEAAAGELEERLPRPAFDA
jgi:hypothetical protein